MSTPRPTFVARPAMRRVRSAQQGFTLVEVLVSLLVFAFGVLGMVAFQAQATRLAVEASERNRAALMTNELAAAMWAAQSTTLPAATLTAWRSRLTDEKLGGLRAATYSIGTADAQGAVAITITWTSATRGSSGAAGRYTTTVALPGAGT